MRLSTGEIGQWGEALKAGGAELFCRRHKPGTYAGCIVLKRRGNFCGQRDPIIPSPPSARNRKINDAFIHLSRFAKRFSKTVSKPLGS